VDQLYVWADTYPADWPLEDQGPGRNRFQGVPKDAMSFVLDPVTGTADVAVWVWQPPAAG